MIASLLLPFLAHYGLQILVGLLAFFGAKRLKEAVLGTGKLDAAAALSDQASTISKNHAVAAQAASADTKEEADAALDALADADRK